jgi:hypothetical protein
LTTFLNRNARNRQGFPKKHLYVSYFGNQNKGKKKENQERYQLKSCRGSSTKSWEEFGKVFPHDRCDNKVLCKSAKTEEKKKKKGEKRERKARKFEKQLVGHQTVF